MNKLPEWFKVGAKAYLYGCSPAYEIMEIKKDSWLAKDNYGDPALYPLDEVAECWSPKINNKNDPKKNRIEK